MIIDGNPIVALLPVFAGFDTPDHWIAVTHDTGTDSPTWHVGTVADLSRPTLARFATIDDAGDALRYAYRLAGIDIDSVLPPMPKT